MTSLLVLAACAFVACFATDQISRFFIDEAGYVKRSAWLSALISTSPAALTLVIMVTTIMNAGGHDAIVRDASFSVLMIGMAGIVGMVCVIAAITKSEFQIRRNDYLVPLAIILGVLFYFPTYIPDFAKGEWFWFATFLSLLAYIFMIIQPAMPSITSAMSIEVVAGQGKALSHKSILGRTYGLWSGMGLASWVMVLVMAIILFWVGSLIGEHFFEASGVLGIPQSALGVIIAFIVQFPLLTRSIALVRLSKSSQAIMQATIVTATLLMLAIPLIMIVNQVSSQWRGGLVDIELIFTPFQCSLSMMTVATVFYIHTGRLSRERHSVSCLEAMGLPMLFLAFIFHDIII